MLSGKEVISRLIIIDNSATIQAYLSLISRLLKMPKANKPNSVCVCGKFKKVANDITFQIIKDYNDDYE